MKIYLIEKSNIKSKISKNNIDKSFKGNVFSLSKNKKSSISTILSSLQKRLKNRKNTIIETSSFSNTEMQEIIEVLNKFKAELVYTDDDKLNKEIKIDKEIVLDVIGDIHGLYDDFIKIIRNLGYDEQGYHKENRKLLLLGDIIDRGPDSLKMIELAKILSKNGHFIIKGNHEDMLINNINAHKEGKEPSGSFAVVKTFKEVIAQPNWEETYNFLNEIPLFYIQDKIVFCHGDISIFEPFEVSEKKLLYGETKGYSKKSKIDKTYQENFDKGINKYTMIRGHIVGDNTFDNVFSLEFQQSFAGNIAALSIDIFNETKSFEKSLTLQKCSFNYKKEKK